MNDRSNMVNQWIRIVILNLYPCTLLMERSLFSESKKQLLIQPLIWHCKNICENQKHSQLIMHKSTGATQAINIHALKLVLEQIPDDSVPIVNDISHSGM